MAHKKLIKLNSPQLWYQEQKNGLVEAVVIENFGRGPAFWRLWVPANSDNGKVVKAIVKRMASDYNIDLQHSSLLMSNRNPINDLPMKDAK